ncbi:MAG: glucose-1-phosphate adenylyltransferase subunit GlgD [Clostridiaceae bacterium]|nr:glucose-1-phosphate adenylyltransferase subunit GlgD [Eubacteriales bacterium]
MLNNAFGLIYTGESNMLLRELTYSRSIAAVPFAGRYRCIDFVLSDLVNSGVTNVGVIAQKNYHSLMDHLGPGKEWDLNRKRDGLFILPPFVTRENTGIYRGTVDALRSVMGYIRRSTQRFVILTGSHTVFNTTFTEMIRRHIDTGADITIMCNRESEASAAESYEDLRLTLDASGRVSDLELNPFRPKSPYCSCDVFLMEKTLLEYLIEEAAAHANTDFTRDVLVKKIATLKMYGFVYEGCVARMNSLGAYFRHNMEVLEQSVRDDLFNGEHPIYTKIKDEVPAVYGAGASVKNSLVADGCIIEGEVENSVLFRGVQVAAGARLSNCIVMQACEIQEGSELDHVVLDKGVTVRRGRRLAGYDSFPVIIRKGSTV